MEKYRPVKSGIINLVPGVQGDPVFVKEYITFKEDIDEAALREAIHRTVQSMPFIAKKIELHEGRYCYVDNPLPFVIAKGLKEVRTFLAEGNYHSLTFAYEKNKLCIVLDHVFFDGMGVKMVLETLLYHYFCVVDDKTYEVPNGVFVNDCEAQGLFDEPYRENFSVDDSPAMTYPKAEREIFSFPELQASASQAELAKVTEFMTISVNSAEFMGYAKGVGGSPLSALTTIWFTVLQKSHPENDKLLRIVTTFSLRDILAAHNTVLNAFDLMSYDVEPEEALRTDREAERDKNLAFRDILKQYRNPESMRKSANKLRGINEEVSVWLGDTSAHETPKIFAEFKAMPVPLYVIYMGSFRLGEYAGRIENIQAFSKINSTYSCAFFEVGDRFFISLRQPFHSELYRDNLLDELKQRGMTSACVI